MDAVHVKLSYCMCARGFVASVKLLQSFRFNVTDYIEYVIE